MASYLVKDTIGSDKAKKIVKTLKEYMTANQESTWQEALNKLGEEPISLHQWTIFYPRY